MLKIKSILFVAGSGFIFSFLTGMLSGNPFSVIFLRSLIGSAFFTLIVTGAVFVLKKALPEISDLMSESDEVITPQENTGGNFDVVIDDDNPYVPADSESEDMDEDKLLRKDFVEEVEEESIDDISILNEADDSDEVIEVMDDSMSSSSLPEIDENVSFLSGPSESSPGGGDNDALNKLGGNVDAGTMAKAIKTILKKDQEG